MNASFCSSAVAKENHGDIRRAPVLLGKGGPHGQRRPAAHDRGRHQGVYLGHGHMKGPGLALVDAGCLAHDLCHDVFGICPLGDQMAVASVITHHDVIGFKRLDNAHGYGLLTVGEDLHADQFALFLGELDQLFFEFSYEQHLLIHGFF